MRPARAARGLATIIGATTRVAQRRAAQALWHAGITSAHQRKDARYLHDDRDNVSKTPPHIDAKAALAKVIEELERDGISSQVLEASPELPQMPLDLYKIIENLPSLEALPNENKDPKIAAVNNFVVSLRTKLRCLNDGMHKVIDDQGNLSGRAKVVYEYYKAAANLAKRLVNLDDDVKPKTVINGVDIYILESSESKAKGYFVAAMKDGKLIGNIFVSNGNNFHLSVASVNDLELKNCGVSNHHKFLIEMLGAFFNHANLAQDAGEKMVNTSCVGFYNHHFETVASRTGNAPSEVFDVVSDEDFNEELQLKKSIPLDALAQFCGSEKFKSLPDKSLKHAKIGGSFNTLDGESPCL